VSTTDTQTMRAVLTTGDAQSPLRVERAPVPSPAAGEVLVRVHATSLNAGELRRAAASPAGNRIGWDFAGAVERAAADGSGPPAGARVVGFADSVAWADYVTSVPSQLGVVPDSVTFDDAATLPVAGLTALRALRHRGDLRGKRVLLAPGNGGVGLFGIQLARMFGAEGTAVVRRTVAAVVAAGPTRIVVGTTADASRHGPYDVILDSLGGPSLAASLASVAEDGIVVNFGNSMGTATTFDPPSFFRIGGASLYGFILFHEAEKEPVGRDLEELASYVASGTLSTNVDATYDLDCIGDAVEAWRNRTITGKVVVRF